MIPYRSIRRTLLGATAIALLWSLALRITGGFLIETPWRTISSRNSVRPLLGALGVIALYLLIWRRHWRDDLGRLSTPGSWPPLLGAISVFVALLVGFGWGAKIGAGPDPSGYVSEAAMFARGELTMEAPRWAQNAPWNDGAYSASPVGWRPTRQTYLLAPTYSPGLPMVMAAFQLIGGRDAVFFVVPLLGGLLVAATYFTGLRLGGPWVGALAAILVTCSPIFLVMVLQAMSDVPVTAFLMLSVAAALYERPLLAGTTAAAALLTRPNLAPLVVVPFLLLMLPRERLVARFAAFAAPVTIAAVVVGTLNWRYYGSPLLSGYGSLPAYYAFENIKPNIAQYWRWFTRSHTAIPLLGFFAAGFQQGRSTERWKVAVVTLGIPLLMLASYLPFVVFHPRDWWYLRFLLPAYPALAVGFGLVAVAVAQRMGRLGTVLAMVTVAVVAAYGWTLSIREGSFKQRIGEARFARAVEYAKRLPEKSVFVSNAHSGTLRFYTGRDIIRFEAIRFEDLDKAVSHLHDLGYSLYLIGDEFEIEQFRTMFAGTRTTAALPKEPRVMLDGVAVYPLMQ